MQLLEKGVHAHFANLQNAPGAGPTTNGTSEPPAVQSLPNRTVASTSAPGAPFAKVNSVVSGSPADQAGLKAGDAIRSFGSVNWLNHERLAKVAETVQQNEGVCTHFISCCSIEMPKCLTRFLYLQRPVSVKVVRKAETGPITELDLQLTPRQNWGGRGMLGCHLVPL